MKIQLLARSASFERHVKAAFGTRVELSVCLSVEQLEDHPSVVFVHAESFGDELSQVISRTISPKRRVGVAADHPQLTDLLQFSALGTDAYFNSHMSKVHYRQAYRMLCDGLSWYPPQLLRGALERARGSTTVQPDEDVLSALTAREREVAVDVARGYSNKRIAEERGITERTVKAHMTRIFKKLSVTDRVALAIMLNGWGIDAEAS